MPSIWPEHFLKHNRLGVFMETSDPDLRTESVFDGTLWAIRENEEVAPRSENKTLARTTLRRWIRWVRSLDSRAPTEQPPAQAEGGKSDAAELLDEHEDDLNEPSEFSELLSWVASNLKGKQRRVMELVIDGRGECPLSDIAFDAAISWESPYDNSFNGIRRAVNLKLNKASVGWRLERNDNKARLLKIGQK